MHKSLLALILGLFCLMANAQYNGYSAMVNDAAFKSNFSIATQKVSTIKSDFTQEKELSLLADKISSKGKFWFKKNNQVRMEYTSPYQYLMVINKDRVFVKDRQKESKINTRSNKMFQQINRVMIDCMQGTVFSNPDFSTRLFENKSAVLIEMTPLTKGLKEMFSHIILVVEKKDFSVVSIRMNEASGDYTTIRFINKEQNVQLPDNLFSVN
ncbi:MAG: outer membrane lipoprotein carrier protein LolA [Chitinophagaceae bacterium]|nr:outer membrane lipoprotein carrier protein LolA [Bacteroidota bacterium]MCC6256921.1 outer membrane lipoprotein carrier protein LolA [Chitinophagaceae bacterium]